MANPDNVAEAAKAAQTALAGVGQVDPRLVSAMAQSSRVGANNYTSTADSGLTKEDRLQLAVHTADRFLRLAYPNIVSSHSFGWLARQTLPAIDGETGTLVSLTEAEAALGFILASLRSSSHQAEPVAAPP